jgi:DNA-binding NarL/FixJ family response regulator
MVRRMRSDGRSGTARDEIKVLVVDDHPALRDGLTALLRQEDGFVAVGSVAGQPELLPALAESRPDVVILDYSLEGGDGLNLCFRIKQLASAPRVVLYSAYVDRVFAVPATLAQADALVSKTAPVDELLDAVRTVAAGQRTMPALHPDTVTAASARLAPSELPIAGMLFARVDVDEIAETLGVQAWEIRRRALRIISRLHATDRNDADAEALPAT